MKHLFSFLLVALITGTAYAQMPLSAEELNEARATLNNTSVDYKYFVANKKAHIAIPNSFVFPFLFDKNDSTFSCYEKGEVVKIKEEKLFFKNDLMKQILQVRLNDGKDVRERILRTADSILFQTKENLPDINIPDGIKRLTDSEEQQIMADLHLKCLGKASFPGGDDACFKFLKENLSFMNKAEENDYPLQVKIDLHVSENGMIDSINILQCPVDSFCQEATRIIKTMPRWIPNHYYGKVYDTHRTLPLTFYVKDDDVDAKLMFSEDMARFNERRSILLHNTNVDYKYIVANRGSYQAKSKKPTIEKDSIVFPFYYDKEEHLFSCYERGNIVKIKEGNLFFKEYNSKNLLYVRMEDGMQVRDSIARLADSLYYTAHIDLAQLPEQKIPQNVKVLSDDHLKNFIEVLTNMITSGPKIGTPLDIELFMSKNMIYPEIARKRKVEGIVDVEFDVSPKGKIENAKIVKSQSKLLNEEALRLVNLLHRIKPAHIFDTGLRSKAKIPIVFSLRGSSLF